MTALVEPPTTQNTAALAVDAPPKASPLLPLSSVTADLMPDEIRTKRRLAYLKRRSVFVLIALVLLVVLGDALVRQQTNSANDELSAANDHITALNQQLGRFSAVQNTQSETQAIWTQLAGVMGNDVAWTELVTKLRRPAPAGMKFTSIGAQVDDPNSTDGAVTDPTAGLTTTSDSVVGSLTLSGTARDWKSVAGYVSALSQIKGFTAVNPSTVSSSATGPGSGGGGGLTFTITLSLTSAALSNRYADAATTPGATAPATAGSPSTTTLDGTAPGGTTTGGTTTGGTATGATGNSGTAPATSAATKVAGSSAQTQNPTSGASNHHKANSTTSQHTNGSGGGTPPGQLTEGVNQ